MAAIQKDPPAPADVTQRRPRAGHISGPAIYNIVDGDPAPVRDWLPVLADALGAKPPRHAPAWLAAYVVGYEVLDGITRHSPEGRWFGEFAAQHGFHAAVRWRDSGRPIPDGGGPVPTTAELDEG
jgi:hypothetical protein